MFVHDGEVMDAEELISLLAKSKNRFLVGMSSQLRGNVDMDQNVSKSVLGLGEDIPIKAKLERLLSSSIVNMKHDGVPYLLSSNVLLMHHLEKRRNPKNRNSVVSAIGRSSKFNSILRSRNQNIVRTWDLVLNDKHTIKLDSKWSILGWILVSSDNFELLGDSINYIISKGNLVK